MEIAGVESLIRKVCIRRSRLVIEAQSRKLDNTHEKEGLSS